MLPAVLDLATLRGMYRSRALTPADVADALLERMARSSDPAIFITPVSRDGLFRQVADLLARAPNPEDLPLWGVPFAVKDNIDVEGLPTTAACPAFAYTPARDAFVVARLRAAGAIVTGKTNLDQFATGLNGTRSPYGAPRCVFDSAYISGGSSSGSAVAVASGLATFALGTDTAGSGRVPAMFNNIVGIKPTPGRLSTSGLVPACRSLDVISIFSTSVADGIEIRHLAEGEDADDPFSNPASLTKPIVSPRVGVLRPADLEFYGDKDAADLYAAAVGRLVGLGATPVPFDYTPFLETAKLLYNGPWVAERLAAIESFYQSNADDIEPAVRSILDGAGGFSAIDAFRGRYRLEALKRETSKTWAAVDVLLLPTAPTTYTVEAMRADPIRLNSHLGQYTNFANLMGLAAIAVPAGFRPNGLPFGVTLVGPGSSDDALAPLADGLHRAAVAGMGIDRERQPANLALPSSDDGDIPIVVVGAHLSGMVLNAELTRLGAVFSRSARTTPDYRLFALQGTVPPKPGLVRMEGGAHAGIEVEVWTLRPEAFASFVAAIPRPLGIGRVALDDGTMPQGFLCEACAVVDAQDISAYGGWRAFVQAHRSP
jgi:allophanate hydrolase